MKVTLKIFFIIILHFNLYAIEINENSSGIEILSKSYIFIDETSILTKSEILEQNFQPNHKKILGLGIVPDKALWIRFTLKNTTSKKIEKLLEYDNPETEDLYFFYDDTVIEDGMFHISKDRESINPNFKISLNAYEEKLFYIKAHCKISTLIAKLTLWNEKDFLKHDYEHKTYLFVFFATIFILLVYNALLLIFTKDIVYLYYVLYLAAVIVFQSIYLGVAQLYFFSNAVSVFVTQATIGYIVMLVTPIILFTMEFLNTKKFKKIDAFFRVYLYTMPIIALLSFDNFLFDLNVMIVFIPLGFAMIYIGVYALYSGVRQAKYYILGWSFVILSLLLSVIKSMGGYDITEHFLYINELAFILEALLFSIALAHRIKILSEEKNKADKKLIEFQKEEHNRLEKLVDERTKELQASLEEKNILYKELNHRIKNNIQMVLSLIRLQLGNSNSKKVKDALTITKNRVNSVANLYEVLYHEKSIKKFDTQIYFENIIKNMRENFSQEINIEYKIDYNINVNDLIYCGIILNELATNSFKYANCKELAIYIDKEGDYLYMIVKDDGDGFKKDRTSSLGLTIIETLVKKQLHGEMSIRSKAGTMTTIKWRDNG